MEQVDDVCGGPAASHRVRRSAQKWRALVEAAAVAAGESAAATSGSVTLTVIQGGGQAAAQGAGRAVIETVSKEAVVAIAGKVAEKSA